MKPDTFFDSSSLDSWFATNKRDFPWRNNPSPYKVWVSEVMLQQTRASVVVDYYENWMNIFPNVHVLARASRDEVLKAWEGLGYYSRARNLHEGSRQVIEKFGGELPQEKEKLSTIKGLGPYTIGAILAFGFKKNEPAVDGNVMRVLARFFLIENDLCSCYGLKKIWRKAEKILERGTYKTSEALIELGATVCTVKKPSCLKCPIQSQCLAFSEGKQEALPEKSKKIRLVKLKRAVVVIMSGTHLLVQKKNEKLMQDLYEFPYFDIEHTTFPGELKHWISESLGLNVVEDRIFPRIQQSFTKYRADLYPFSFQISKRVDIAHFEWASLEKIQHFSFSSGHRKILKEFISKNEGHSS